MNLQEQEITEEIKIKIRIVIVNTIILIASGTILFHFFEGWSYVDSFYFLCVTITTIGYGDLYPTTDLTKILTVFYAFSGIGIILLVAETFTKAFIRRTYRNVKNKQDKKIK